MGGHMYTGFWGGETGGKTALGIPRLKWEDIIKVDLIKIE